MTLQKSRMGKLENLEEKLTSSREDSPAKRFQLQANEEDLRTLEELCSSRLQESPKKSNHGIYCLKTLKGYYLTRQGGRSELSSIRWMNSGTTVNGSCLTLKISESPQNRERVFIIGHSRRFPRREIFPIEGENKNSIKLIGKLGCINNDMRSRVYASEGISPTLNTCQGGANEPKVIIPVLTPDRAKKRQNGRRFKEPGEPMFTLTSQDRHGVALTEKPPHIPGPEDINNTVRASGRGSPTAKHNHDAVHDGIRIRRLTPLETFRLQGFPDSHHDNAKAAGVSDSQLYKQAGNAVTVNVVYEIARRFQND